MSDDTRGILRPAAIGDAFTLDRRLPPRDLADTIDRHWIVAWDLRGRPAYRSEVLTHPSVHVVLEPHGCFVYGVRRRLDARILSGTGYAIGTKFLPAGFSAFTDRPIGELTDSVLPLAALFGPDATEVGETHADPAAPESVLGPLADLLRAHRGDRAPEAELAHAVVEDMRTALPGATVADIAKRHAVATRTLQRVFARHVGASPKWVLQRYRLHEALEALGGAERPDWTRLALDLGYFDHAHFIRDFRAVAGRTPTQYDRSAREHAA